MIYKVNVMLLWGLFLGFPSTLCGAQETQALMGKQEGQLVSSPKNGKKGQLLGKLKQFIQTKKAQKTKNWKCKSIQKCNAFVTVLGCLQYWHKVNRAHKPKSIFGYLSSDNYYNNIVDAYHHLLEVHLSPQHNKADYTYMHAKVRQEVLCDFGQCSAYTRNQRERGKAGGTMAEDKEYICLRDLLDTMHAYLVHGYDSGHRYIAPAENKKLYKIYKRPIHDISSDSDDEKDESDDESDDDPDELFDVSLKKIQVWQAVVKKHRNQSRKSKFQTTVHHKKKIIDLAILKAKFGQESACQLWLSYLKEHECDTDNLLEAVAADEKETMICLDSMLFKRVKQYIKAEQAQNGKYKAQGYGFGVRLYYWHYYKHNEEAHWRIHPNIKYADLYVSAAFLSFKDEILEKDIPIGQWHQAMYTAAILLGQSTALRKLTVDNPSKLAKAYSFVVGDVISKAHILAICFYTNFTSLLAGFRRSFRYLSHTDSVQNVARRNAKWHYLAKYLREVVEIFGEEIKEDHSPKRVANRAFYHGLSYVSFSEFSRHFYAPLSTSRQLEVALLFTDKQGIVVHLAQEARGLHGELRFFNVGLISAFGVEDEQLFIGGQYPLKIASIRLLETNRNTAPLMHTLSIVQHMIKGDYLFDQQVASVDIAIFERLSLSLKKMPPYVQQIWKGFTHKQQSLTLNLHCMHMYYTSFLGLLFSSDPACKNLLLFDQVTKLFPNVAAITCKATDCTGINNGWQEVFSPSIVGASFILGVKAMLANIAQNKQHKLQKIVIKTSRYSIEADCTVYAPQFASLGWDIQKTSYASAATKKHNQISLTKVDGGLK